MELLPGVGQGAASESIRGNMDFFATSAIKKQEPLNKNARSERLFIRKASLSAILCCRFGARKYYYK